MEKALYICTIMEKILYVCTCGNISAKSRLPQETDVQVWVDEI